MIRSTGHKRMNEHTSYIYIYLVTYLPYIFQLKGGEVAQSVERATPGQQVLGAIPAVAARPLLVRSVSVKFDRLRQKSWSPRSVS